MAGSSLLQPLVSSSRRLLRAPYLLLSFAKGEASGHRINRRLSQSFTPSNFFPKIPHRCIRRSIAPAMSESSSSQAASTSSPQNYRRANRLASENSPYLLQHAYNPVDWYPWGEEAFSVAREKNIPIFLSIGYSTCHWCHVMEVESFENEEVANLLNESFVSIKVDREERPDVDKVYMTFVQALYGNGGWPLTVFLSPDLKPLVGGTYFPPDDKYGRIGFKTVLRKVKDAWETKREKLVEGGTLAIEQLSSSLSVCANSKKFTSEIDTINRCAEQLSQSYDSQHGGFGSAPKFPRPVEIQLMLYYSRNLNALSGETGSSNEALKIVTHSLMCMAKGGIHDHVGGGFHRYSVDELWHVPHFEKMLYDQAQLANVYLDTFSITQNEFFSNVARGILDYLMRQMVGGHGGIFSAEDADSAEHENSLSKKEGAFYVWTREQVEDVLGDRASIFIDHYQIKSPGNCDFSTLSDPHGEFKGKNVLIQRNNPDSMASTRNLSVEEYFSILGDCRKKLFDVRTGRPKPHLDDKVIVAWNGLAISSFAKASAILIYQSQNKNYLFPVAGSHPKVYYEVAEKAASFIKENLYDKETQKLRHSYRNGPSKAPAFLDDYAFLISGLLDLYEVGGSFCWLEWAITLQKTQDELFLDKEGGAYFNTAGEDSSILLRVKEDHDGAEPSGNSVSAINLIKLSTMVRENKSKYYRENTEHLLAVFKRLFKETAMAVPLMCCAAEMFRSPSWLQVVLIGSESSEDFCQMLSVAHCYHPNRTVIHVDPKNIKEMEFWEDTNERIAEMAKNNFYEGKICALVCQNFTCKLPVFNKIDLESMLQKL